MNTTVIIIDDEPAAIEVIRELCLLREDMQVVATASNGIAAMENIRHFHPDLIFLDVNMPFMNGIELMHQRIELDFEVIFTTGSDEYALQALKFEAIDYLLKPIDPVEFSIACDKFMAKHTSTTDKKMHFPTAGGSYFVKENDILYVEGQGSYSIIHTSSAINKIMVSKNIGNIQNMLSERFFRCHNSYIVNLECIEKVDAKKNCVYLPGNIVVEVSRRNKPMLLMLLKK